MKILENITKKLTIRHPAIATLGIHWALPAGIILAALMLAFGKVVPFFRMDEYSTTAEMTIFAVFCLMFVISLAWLIPVGKRQWVMPFVSGVRNYPSFVWYWFTLLILNAGTATFFFAYLRREEVTYNLISPFPLMLGGLIFIATIGLFVFYLAAIRASGMIFGMCFFFLVTIGAALTYSSSWGEVEGAALDDGFDLSPFDLGLLGIAVCMAIISIVGISRRRKLGWVRIAFAILAGLSLLSFVIAENAIPGASSAFESVYDELSDDGMVVAIAQSNGEGGWVLADYSSEDYWYTQQTQFRLRWEDGGRVREAVGADELDQLCLFEMDDYGPAREESDPFVVYEDGAWKLSWIVKDYLRLKSTLSTNLYATDNGLSFYYSDRFPWFDIQAAVMSRDEERLGSFLAEVCSEGQMRELNQFLEETGFTLSMFMSCNFVSVSAGHNYIEGAHMLTFWLLGVGVLAQIVFSPLVLFLGNQIRSLPE